MDENKDKAIKKDTSSEAALERGRTAVAADKVISKKDNESIQIKRKVLKMRKSGATKAKV